MTIDTLVRSETELDSESVDALARAAAINRGPQHSEVAAIRRRARQTIRSEPALANRFEAMMDGLARRYGSLEGNGWPDHVAFEAMTDALVAKVAGGHIPRRDWEVLAWPWMAVFGPIEPHPSKASDSV